MANRQLFPQAIGGGGATPGGVSTDVQFNDGGALGGDARFTFDKSNGTVVVSGGTYVGPAQSTFDAFIRGYFGLYTTADSGLQSWSKASHGVGLGGAAQSDGSYNTFGLLAASLSINTVDQLTRSCGVEGDAYAIPSVGKTLKSVEAVVGYAENSGPGIVTDLVAIEASGNGNTGGGTVTNNYGVRIEDEHGIGANNYALGIADQGTGTNDYAIYVAGGKVKFAGGATGLQVGAAPTGGDKGAGTINVSGGYYVNGSLIGLIARTNVTKTTASLANNGNEISAWTSFAKSFAVVQITVDRPARVRFYSTAAQRDADVTRSQFVLPALGTSHGVIMDFVLDGSLTAPLSNFICSPEVYGANADGPVASTVYYTITNMSGSSSTVTVTLTIKVEEA